MLQCQIGVLGILFICVTQIHGWDFDYININPEVDVTDVDFRLYSTRYQYGDDTHTDILFDEETEEATLEENWFNSSIPTKIVAHGNGGAWGLVRSLWKNYTQVADEIGQHYNLIAMHWGSGPEKRHAWTGIKTAKVVKSFVEKYGLKITDIHGIGFSYGAHVINAMATELDDIGFGKIDRLTLLDPGCKVPVHNIDGKEQYGLIHKEDASFVDVFHTSTTGIWQMPVGDVDVWVNGGKAQPWYMDVGAHQAAVYYFSRTIIMTSPDGCQYIGWQCIDPDWTSYKWADRNEEDTCEFGDQESKNVKKLEYIGWQCTDPDWTSYKWADRNEEDTCEFGDQKSKNAIQVLGEYINRDEAFLSTGNFIFFTNNEFGYCEDLICDEVC